MARRLRTDNGPGHNSVSVDIDEFALGRFVDRLVILLGERDNLNADVKAVYDEAKEAGFVTRHLRQIVREKRMDPQILSDHLEAMDALRHALGMLAETPLGKAAETAASRKRKPKTEEALAAAREHLGSESPPPAP